MLTAVVEAVIRRSYGRRGPRQAEVYGQFRFDIAPKSISRGGVVLPTTKKEFLLALTLFRNFGRTLSRGYLMDTVWNWGPGPTARSMRTSRLSMPQR